MLRRALSRAALAATAGIAAAALWQGPAVAGGSPGGGFGGTECGQAGTPSCTITAGTAPRTGAAAPGDAGSSRAGGTPASAGDGCTGTVSTTFGCIPPGCTVTAQTLACPLGDGAPPGGEAGPALPGPGALAQLAVSYLRLPDPVIRSSPGPGTPQLTQLPVWLWIAPQAWQPQSRTAQVPGESVTATATPVSAAWDMGDGTTVTCQGPGTAYPGGNPAAASPTCGHTYDQSSAGQPGGAYKVTVTITWDITWQGTGGTGGTLAPLQTAGTADFQVAESQALNTSSGG